MSWMEKNIYKDKQNHLQDPMKVNESPVIRILRYLILTDITERQ